MYLYVQNEVQLRRFRSIWQEVWNEKGFEVEDENEVKDRILIVNETNLPVGTIEVKPYHICSEHPLNATSPFHLQEEIVQAPNRVAEIDKVAMLKEHRGPNLVRLISTLVYYAAEHQIDYYVCLLEPVFLRALRISFRIPMRVIGEKFYYKGDYVVPTIIYCGYVRDNASNYPWISHDMPSFPKYQSVVI